MRIRKTITLLGLIAIAAGAVSTAALPAAASDGVAKRAAKGELRPAVLKMQVQKDGQTVTVTRPMPFLSSGTLSAAAEALAAQHRHAYLAKLKAAR